MLRTANPRTAAPFVRAFRAASARQGQQHGSSIDSTKSRLHTRRALPTSKVTPVAVSKWKWEESSDAIQSYCILFGILGIGSLQWAQQFNLSSVFYFVALAVTTIYIGAHKGLTTGVRQQISVKEGLLAPVAASVSLFSLYVVIKYFPNLSLQTFLDVYFFLIGSIAIAGGASSVLRVVPGLAKKSIELDLPKWLLIDEQGNAIELSRNCPADVLGIVVGITLAAADVACHHGNFTLSNLVACSVAADILQLVGIRSFKTAVVLLLGLLCYDVVWVFGSPLFVGDNVMLTVATSEVANAPTRLLFPRIPGGIGDAASFPYSLLGLGDVAVPGLLACLALRYDASRAVDMAPRATAAFDAIDAALGQLPKDAGRREVDDAVTAAAFQAYDKLADADDARRDASTMEARTSVGPALEQAAASAAVLQQRRYFWPVMVSYLGGLVVAFVANSVTGLGQPALLYLCPATLGAVVLTAAQRREVRRIWSFVDLPSNVPKLKK